MEVLLQRPLILFLIAGIGCGLITLLGLRDAVKRWRMRTGRADPESDAAPVSHPHLRFAGSLVLLAALAFFTLQLLSGVVRMTPPLLEMDRRIGSALEPVAYLRLGEGEPVVESLSQLRGDVILLNVWATWCPPCRKEMPHLDQLQKELGARGLRVVHLSREDPARLESWLAENPMTTRHGRVESLPFPVPALPTTLVIDREGIVRDVLVGGQSHRAFEKAVTPWL